jgi:hypothetical protein
MTYNDLQTLHRKLKIEQPEMISGAPEGFTYDLLGPHQGQEKHPLLL